MNTDNDGRMVELKLISAEFGTSVNLTRWSRVLRDTAASQLNDNISRSAGAFARLGSG